MKISCAVDRFLAALKGAKAETTRRWYERRLRARAAGVERGWNPHNWRHGAARRMLMDGASLGQVSQLLGHSSVDVTNAHYGMFADRELKRAHARHIKLPDRNRVE